MTFARFEEMVKERYPEAELFKHGEFAGNKINVAIVFNPRSAIDPYTMEWTGKVYQYNGTYCEVLNRIGIKAIYKHDLDAYYNRLERAKRMHGQEGWFGDIIDNTEEIARLEKEISDYENNYVIV